MTTKTTAAQVSPDLFTAITEALAAAEMRIEQIPDEVAEGLAVKTERNFALAQISSLRKTVQKIQKIAA